MTYGYVRVSTIHQRMARQITNILEVEPKATIFKEHFTGTTLERPMWSQLLKKLKPGDRIIFDSVSRFARTAKEGFEEYKKLFEAGIDLVFINEPLINTSVFAATRSNLLTISVSTGNEAVDTFFKGNIELINNFLMALAEEQIKAAFDQSEKEVLDLHSRISQGLREAKKNGSQIGLPKGTTLETKKSIHCKSVIERHSKDFSGTLDDPDVIKLCGCSRNSYYKYKKEIKSRNNS